MLLGHKMIRVNFWGLMRLELQIRLEALLDLFFDEGTDE